MIDLSIVIVNYNTKNLVSSLLNSLDKAIVVAGKNGFRIQTIVVDNHSVDDSPKEIRQHYPWVTLIENKANFGFSKGNNIGIVKTKGRLVLLLNSDTLVFPQTLIDCIGFIDKNPKIGVMTCKVELSNGLLDPASHRGFPTPWNAFCYFMGLEKIFPHSRIFSGYHQGWKDLTKPHQIDVCSGAFFLVKKEVIKQVGLLDEDFFMYGEDIDWAWRIKKAGWLVFYYPQAKIIHYKRRSGREKISDGALSGDAYKKIRQQSRQSFFDTMKLFYKKHYVSQYPPIIKKIIFTGVDILNKFRK